VRGSSPRHATGPYREEEISSHGKSDRKRKLSSQARLVLFVMKIPSTKNWQSLEWAILVAATLLLLLPFVSKPFHIDDPMYLWSAQHIRQHPLDFYGFEVNWYNSSQLMSVVNLNPPLFDFVLAGVSLLLGWSEVVLHLAMLVPAVAVVLGVWRLARQLSAPPLLSALALLSLPGFLVSATTLMPDVLATAFWCWAVVLWMEGLSGNRTGLFVGAGFLTGVCLLTKYVGLGLIPLFLVHGALVRRRPGLWVVVPIMAALIALAFAGYMHSLYGINPFAYSTAYALRSGEESGTWLSHTLVGLAFLGGSAVTVAFLMPWLWSGRQIAGFCAAVLGLAIAFSSFSGLLTYPLPSSPMARCGLVAHLAVFVCLGLQIAGLAVRHLVRERSPENFLLALWIAGIFVFSAFANWTTNVRSLVPALPAVAILLLAEARRGEATESHKWRLLTPLAMGGAISLIVAHADYALARASRAAAEDLSSVARDWKGPVRFLGTWGFQHYMESRGVRKFDLFELKLDPGTLVIVAPTGYPFPTIPDFAVETIGIHQYTVPSLASTLSMERGSGFYTAFIGQVPFLIERAPPEKYVLWKILQPISFVLPHDRS
jgi:dolichyl-phosphate-mannose-protein mannosyltransferase